MIVDQDTEREHEVLEVLSGFVTEDTPESVLREQLARLWQVADCSLLRAVLAIVAEFDPGDAEADQLRSEIRALLQSRFSSDRSLERPAPRIDGVTRTGTGTSSYRTFHISH